jgi:hypothetical protein
MLTSAETDGGIPLEPGDVGTLVEHAAPDYIIEFEFNADDPTGGTFDTACVGVEAFAIIGTS